MEKYAGYCGIQCKGKDDYTNAQLTEVEIDNEIDKAKTFSPKLKRFIFATTANKDAVIEQYIRQKDMECIDKDCFMLMFSPGKILLIYWNVNEQYIIGI